MKRILLALVTLAICTGLCSCKEINAAVPNIPGTYTTDSTAESEKSTASPETPSTEESETDVETEADTTAYIEIADSETSAEETQIGNILKLPLAPENTKGYVYLTIDDGPSDKTGAVLDILKEYNVNASFFFVGGKMRSYSDAVLRAFNLGNNIGCHSMTHDYHTIYGSGQAIADDISAWENATAAILGDVPGYKIYRFPGGTTNTVIVDNYAELKAAVVGKGYRSFDWNCANCDKWFVPKPEDQSIEDYLKSSVISTLQTARGPKVMLIHETVRETVEMLPWIIEYIRSEGYEFALLSDFDGEYVFRR